MANSIFCSGATALLNGCDWEKDNISVAVVGTVAGAAFTFDITTQTLLSEIQANVIATAPLTCKELDEKTQKVHAEDVVLRANTSAGNPCDNFSGATGLVLYKDNCDATLSTLIAYIDSGVRGFPLTCSSDEFHITWDKAGIMSWAPCTTGLTLGSAALVLPAGTCDAASLDKFNIWFGYHTVSSPNVVNLEDPILDNLGQTSCSYAKAYLSKILNAELALMQKKFVRWGDRSITFSNLGEISVLKREWEHRVQTACDNGCSGKRRPFYFRNAC